MRVIESCRVATEDISPVDNKDRAVTASEKIISIHDDKGFDQEEIKLGTPV